VKFGNAVLIRTQVPSDSREIAKLKEVVQA
jgi:hypothetical protein